MGIFIVIAIFIIIVTLMILMGLTTTILETFKMVFRSSFSYFQGMKFSVHKGFSKKAREKFEDNAVENYFFYKQYEDLKNTWISTASINEGNILILKKNMFERRIYTPTKLKFIKVVSLIVGNIFSITFFIIHFTIITILSIPVYLFYFIVSIVEKIRIKLGKISGICVHCSAQFKLPHYVCKKCGRVHKNLIPSSYGIFNRKCVCGEVLPCTSFGGRSKLKAICPKCSMEFKGRQSSPVCISVVGEKGVGKTTLIHSLIECLNNNIKLEKKWKVDISNEDTKIYNIFINSNKFSSEKLLYLYDIEGEHFEKKQNIKEVIYYNYINGLIFIIDPLVSKRIFETNDLIDRFTAALRETREIKLNEFIDVPIVVVIKNTDAFSNTDKELILRKLDYNFSKYKFFCVNSLNESKDICEVTKWILSETNKELK